ncbi:MAG: hypothetical protein WC348_00285 [Patescibacteria group bacterium]|jgi:hypothetical protein
MTEKYRIIYQNQDVGFLTIENAEKIVADAPESVRDMVLAVWDKIINIGIRQSGDIIYESPKPVPAVHRSSILWLELKKYGIRLKSVEK